MNVHEWKRFNPLYSGRYSEYLVNYYRIFRPEELKYFKFTDLIANPREILETICDSSNIDKAYYGNYNFAVHNPSFGVRNYHIHHLYLKIGEKFSPTKYPTKPRIRRFLLEIRKKWDKIYTPVNLMHENPVSISDQTRSFLDDYYGGGETEALAKILGAENFSW